MKIAEVPSPNRLSYSCESQQGDHGGRVYSAIMKIFHVMTDGVEGGQGACESAINGGGCLGLLVFLSSANLPQKGRE
jgi:hypothetical protein